MTRRRTGLQYEITTTLAGVVVAGLAIVALATFTVALRAGEREAAERLRLKARQLERAVVAAPGRLGDLAALIRALPSEELPSDWWVVTLDGRILARSLPDVGELPESWSEIETQRGQGRVASGSEVVKRGLPPRDVVLYTRLADRSGNGGTLVGRVRSQVLLQRSLPLLGVAAWGLTLTAAIFVTFGTWLLRRRLVVPVHEIQAAASRIADGDLEARVDVPGTDELSELGAHFNHMAQSLAQQRQALLEAQRRLVQGERLAAAGRLASGIAHEIGNPLAAILGYTELALRDSALAERTRETQTLLREEALRIRSLIKELLDLARSSRLEVTAVCVDDLLERVTQRLRAQPLLEGLDLVVELARDPTLRVDVDADRVEQVLVNLIENSAHALDKQTQPAPRIELAARRVGSGPSRRREDVPRIGIHVIDNGPGIDPDHLPHVFEPFFTTKEPGSGTGLGLWNAHRIAELLGGRLEVESRAGHTRFSLLLCAADTPGKPCPHADS